MPGVIGLIFQIAVLWFLISYFTREKDPNTSLRKSAIVVIGMLIVSLFLNLAVTPSLGPWASVLLSLVALYLLVEKVCDTRPRATFWIVGVYLGAMILVGVVLELLAQPTSL